MPSKENLMSRVKSSVSWWMTWLDVASSNHGVNGIDNERKSLVPMKRQVALFKGPWSNHREKGEKTPSLLSHHCLISSHVFFEIHKNSQSFSHPNIYQIRIMSLEDLRVKLTSWLVNGNLPVTYPARNKGLVRPYHGKPMVRKPLMRPSFCGLPFQVVV